MHKLKSRKLWMAIIPAVLIVVEELAGLDLNSKELAAQIVPFVMYILGESYNDSRHVSKF